MRLVTKCTAIFVSAVIVGYTFVMLIVTSSTLSSADQLVALAGGFVIGLVALLGYGVIVATFYPTVGLRRGGRA